MPEPAPESRQCPYCGCGFEPQQPDQRYCSPFCEQQHRLERPEEADDPSGPTRS